MKTMKLNKQLVLTLVLLLNGLSSFAQAPSFNWAKKIGASAEEVGYSVAVDATGNVYSTGFFSGTVDFDPSAAIFNLASNGNFDIYIKKLDASGNFLWAKTFGGANQDQGLSLAIDGSGNILTTGFFNSTVDFDPGAGVFNMTASSQDVFISKLDASGNFVWAKKIGAGSFDTGNSIATDLSGNVYTTGQFAGTADFNPGAGVFNLTATGYDAFISKLDAAGNFVWAKSFIGVSSDEGNEITIDASGNVYSTGRFVGTVDFDPGAGFFNITGSGSTDAYISKLDASGNFIWAKALGGSAGSTTYGLSISVDGAGNVFSTGGFMGNSDFDPSIGTYTLNSLGSFDIFVSKLDALGNFVWAKQIGGTGVDITYGIAVDNSGGVYGAGRFQNTVDFDPGAGTYTLLSASTEDGYFFRLDGNGNFSWAFQFGSTSVNSSNSVFVDANNAVYGTGYFSSGVDFDPGIGVFNLSSSGNTDAFVLKLSQCLTPSSPTNSTLISNQTLCANNTTTLSATSASATINWFATPSSTVVLGTGTNYITPTLTAGTYTYYAEAFTCTTSIARTAITVTVNAAPTITVNSGTICSGNNFTINPSGASTYTVQGGNTIVSPTSNSSYTVVGTSTAGCVSQGFATSTVTVNALPTITVNSGAICSGNNFTINPSGASTYTVQGGNTVVSPTSNASYTVVGTSTAGCVSQGFATSNVTVNTLPTLSASTSNSLLCVGQTATLTGIGASTYTFNPGGAGTSIAVTPTITSNYTVTGTDANGCMNSTTITQSVSACTGINEIANSSNELIVYPNPFNNKVTIVSSGEKQGIQVYNALGLLIYKTTIENKTTEIDLSEQASGIYFIRIGKTTKKIIKE